MALIINQKIDHFIYLAQCLSTNDYANTLVSKNNPNDNIAIYCFNQTKGRGQIGRTWYSGQDKNLAFSLILRFNQFKIEHAQYLNLWLACVIRKFIASLLPDHTLEIKWPNDIYVNDLKIAGLLIQSSITGQMIKNGIFGVGININQKDFPADLPNPVSLYQLKHCKFDLIEMARKLSKFFESSFDQLQTSNWDNIKTEYLSHLYLLDKWHTFARASNGEPIKGKIIGIDEEGNLRIESNSKVESFKFREIIY